MDNHIFRVDKKLWYRELVLYLCCATPVAYLMWSVWKDTHGLYALITFVVLAVGLAVISTVMLLPRPKLTVDGKGLQFGGNRVDFDRVEDITVLAGEYIFYTGDKRRVKIDLGKFSPSGRKKIDALVAARIQKIFATKTAAGIPIVGPEPAGRYDFDFTEIHSRTWFGAYVACSVVITLTGATLLVFLAAIGPGALLRHTEPLALALMVPLWFIVMLLEKNDRRYGFSYREGVFTLSKGDKVKRRFTGEDVISITSDPRYKEHIYFNLTGGKIARIYLKYYAKADRKILVSNIKSVFYLPGK